MKTSELIGAQLDWAVAKCDDEYIGMPEIIKDADEVLLGFIIPDGYIEGLGDVVKVEEYSPSTDWSQGGPIIEREGIAIYLDCKRVKGEFIGWWFAKGGSSMNVDGETPLIAAMRCYVRDVLGDTIEIPEELL